MAPQVRVSPEQARDKWVNRLSAAQTEITDGINRVQVAPGQLAAAKYQKWLQALQDSAPKWRRNVAAVSLEAWKDAAIKIGVPRIASGAQAKQGKFLAFAQSFFPHLEQGMSKVHAMDDTTQEARIQRAVAMMRHNATYKRPGTS